MYALSTYIDHVLYKTIYAETKEALEVFQNLEQQFFGSNIQFLIEECEPIFYPQNGRE